MQLSEEQIKQAILHPYPPVRRLALEYFSRSFCQDDTVMPFVIEAMKSLDERELFPAPVIAGRNIKSAA